MSDINVTPLCGRDVVLLIIFIINHSRDLAPSAADVAEGNQSGHADGVGEHHHRRRQARRHLLEHRTADGQDDLLQRLRGIARQEPQPEVHIRATECSYQFVGQVAGRDPEIGIRKVAFITDRSPHSRGHMCVPT